MLRPLTGDGAKPRMGRFAGGVDERSVFAAELLLISGVSLGAAAALAFLASFCVADRVDFTDSSGFAACFCFSSASSVWMRCSIFSIFFRRRSFAPSSAAQAAPPVRLESALAASSMLSLLP